MRRLPLLERWLEPLMPHGRTVLRLGLGLMMVMAGGHKMISPEYWAGYVAPAFEPFLIGGAASFMGIVGIFETFLGLMILSNMFARLAALITTIHMFGIVVNLLFTGSVISTTGQPFGSMMGIFIRDVGLLAFALGYTLLPPREESE